MFAGRLPRFYPEGAKTRENYHKNANNLEIGIDIGKLFSDSGFVRRKGKAKTVSGPRGRRFKSCHPDSMRREALRPTSRRAFSFLE